MRINMKELDNKPKGYYDNIREDMLKYIPCDVEKTLEFGCGSGGFSGLVKDKFGAEVWAVEIDGRSAKAASKYFTPTPSLKNQVRVGRAIRLWWYFGENIM